MARSGYTLEHRTDRKLSFVHHRRPGWTIAGVAPLPVRRAVAELR